MADSRSHSFFISIHHQAAKVRKRIFNQRVEHSSPTAQKFHVTHLCHLTDEMDVACTSPPLVFHFRAGTVASMNKTVIEVQVRAVLPTSGGCAVFIGNNEKVFIIYVDHTVGSAITMFMRQITKQRPRISDAVSSLNVSSTSSRHSGMVRLCTARLTLGTRIAAALSSSMPRPRKSGTSATSPAISPQTPTQMRLACAASATILSKRSIAGCVGSYRYAT